MLSVVIAGRNCERALVRTLSGLVGAAVAGHVRDVIVADGGSTDDTAQAAEIAGCTVLVSTAPLGDRLRAAASQARGAWLVFLRPGVMLDGSWAEEAVRFAEGVDLSGASETAAVFRTRTAGASGASFGAQAIALVRDALRRAPSPAQGLVIARRSYEQLGGHSGRANDPEADLIARIGARRIARLQAGIVTTGIVAP